MNTKEQYYLRNELNSRIMLTYSHSHTTMTFVITTWSVLITLLSLFHENFSHYYIVASLIAPAIVFITLCYVHFASQKYRENMVQIVKISTYFACFYNAPALPTEEIDAWELITMDMQNDNDYSARDGENVLPRMNGEYVFCSIVTCVINLVLFIVSAVSYFQHTSIPFIIFCCAEYVFIFVASVWLIKHIHNNTSLKEYHEDHATMFAAWLKYAIKHNFISKEDAMKKYATMNSNVLDRIENI